MRFNQNSETYNWKTETKHSFVNAYIFYLFISFSFLLFLESGKNFIDFSSIP